MFNRNALLSASALLIIYAIAICVGHTAAFADNSVSVPPSTLSEWRIAIANAPALEFEWTVERKCLLSASELTDKLRYAGKVEEFPYHGTTRYTILGAKVRGFRRIAKIMAAATDARLSSANPKSKPVPITRHVPPKLREDLLEQESAFDANKFYEGTWNLQGPDPTGKHKMLFISTLDELRSSDPLANVIWPDYLIEAGIFAPATPREMGKLPVPLPLYWIEGHQDSPRLESVLKNDKGIQLVFERASSQEIEDITIDAGPKYSIQQWHTTDRQRRLLTRRHYVGHSDVPGCNISLPTSIRIEYFRWETNPDYVSNSPCVELAYHLTSIKQVAQTDGLFSLNYTEPGDYIADRTLPESKQRASGQVEYRVPVDPANLDVVIAEAKKGNRVSSLQTKSSDKRYVFIVINLVIILAIVVRLLLRRKSSA